MPRSKHTHRGRQRSDLTHVPPPAITPELADELVKLLHSGVPVFATLPYLVPEFNKTAQPATKASWLNKLVASPEVMVATRAFNGGTDWHKLEPDRRLEIALNKHYAELAYFLYTNDYRSLEGTELKKADTAREAIASKLKVTEGIGETPWTRFMRDVVEGKVNVNTGPPVQVEQLQTTKTTVERVKKILES